MPKSLLLKWPKDHTFLSAEGQIWLQSYERTIYLYFPILWKLQLLKWPQKFVCLKSELTLKLKLANLLLFKTLKNIPSQNPLQKAERLITISFKVLSSYFLLCCKKFVFYTCLLVWVCTVITVEQKSRKRKIFFYQTKLKVPLKEELCCSNAWLLEIHHIPLCFSQSKERDHIAGFP